MIQRFHQVGEPASILFIFLSFERVPVEILRQIIRRIQYQKIDEGFWKVFGDFGYIPRYDPAFDIFAGNWGIDLKDFVR